MEHFFPQIQVKTKKKVFAKNGTLFSSGHLRSDAHQSQIIGGINPPSPRVLAPLLSSTLYDIFAPKKILFRKFLMTLLYLLAVWAPRVKNPGYAYV